MLQPTPNRFDPQNIRPRRIGIDRKVGRSHIPGAHKLIITHMGQVLTIRFDPSTVEDSVRVIVEAPESFTITKAEYCPQPARPVRPDAHPSQAPGADVDNGRA